MAAAREKHGNETEDDEITVTMRKAKPAHYILEIKSLPFLLKILSKTQFHKYESSAFEACGHKWRLILHPEFENENQGNGDAYLSLYLQILGIESLELNWKIDALIKFFVYDHGTDGYITIQDGKVKRFSAEKHESGFSGLMLDLDENTCKFGVEVFVVKSESSKGEECCPSILEPSGNNTVTMSIRNFSKSSEPFSTAFRMGNYHWKLLLYPKGVPEVKRKYLSIYLFLLDSEYKRESGIKLHVQLKLGIKLVNSQSNPKTRETKYDPRKPRTGNAWFSTSQSRWGFPYFMKLADLKQTLGLIVDDHFTAEAEFNFIYRIQDLPLQPNHIDTPPS